MRQFKSSTGRQWAVQLAKTDVVRIGTRSTLATGEVLRFSSRDGLVCDLEEFPSDWERFTETGLLSLLGMAMADWTRRVG